MGALRAQSEVIHHTELKSSHLPFLSMLEMVVGIIREVVKVVSETKAQGDGASQSTETRSGNCDEVPKVNLRSRST